MFEFVNDNDYDCGQAAAATFLAHYNYIPGNQTVLKTIEKEFPPDVLFGWLGTSSQRIAEICEKWGCKLKETDQLCYPMIVLLQDGELGGHWTVVTEREDGRVYLTNYGWLDCKEFFKLWNGIIPRLAHFNSKGFIKGD